MGNTMVHMVNPYTRTVQFEGLSAKASCRLQKVGGMVLAVESQTQGRKENHNMLGVRLSH